MNENKTENVKESIEPVDVDKAGSKASEEGTHGMNKMFVLLGYSKVGVYKSRGKDSTNANWGLISQRAQVCKPGLSLCMLRGSEYNIMRKLLTSRFCCLFVWVKGWHPIQVV